MLGLPCLDSRARTPVPGLPERSGQANHGRAASGPGFCGGLGLRGLGARGLGWLAWRRAGLMGLWLACGRHVLAHLHLFVTIFAYRLAFWLIGLIG